MRNIESPALVLDRREYRDRDLLISVLTPDFGTVRGIFRNARGGRAPRSSIVETLSLVQCWWHLGPNAELASFRQIESKTSSYPLAHDFERSSAAAVVAEALAVFCPQGESAPRRFRMGRALLHALLEKMDPSAAIFYAQYWLLRLGGLLPGTNFCSECGEALAEGFYLPDDADQATCLKCGGGGRIFDAEDYGFMMLCFSSSPGPKFPKPSLRLISWMDLRLRSLAESPLRALGFFRKNCSS